MKDKNQTHPTPFRTSERFSQSAAALASAQKELDQLHAEIAQRALADFEARVVAAVDAAIGRGTVSPSAEGYHLAAIRDEGVLAAFASTYLREVAA